MPSSALLRVQLENTLIHRVSDAFSPKSRVAPQLFSTGVCSVDELTGGGVPRGAITQIMGPASSGRTALLLSLLADATQRAACAWVDVHDALHPESAAAAGVDLKCLLWLRASGHILPGKEQKPWSRLDQALKATDLLLQAGGFAVIVLDMSDVLPQHALRVPLASWYRFRLAAEQAQSALIVVTQIDCAKSSSAFLLRCESPKPAFWTTHKGLPLFEFTHHHVRMERKRGDDTTVWEKKSPNRVDADWTGKTLWAH